VTQTSHENLSGSFLIALITGAIFIASGRVPKIANTFILKAPERHG
jgi:hypothetical protein